MTKRSKRSKAQRGYVMMVVMIMIVILTTAGVYGLRTAEKDVRAGAAMWRSDVAAYAAEAGVGLRMAELMLATEDAGAGLTSEVEVGGPANDGWWLYPPVAPTPDEPQADYRVVALPIVATGATPPPGVQVGSAGQITVWRVEGFAFARTGAAGRSGGQRVSVGMSVWSRGGMSYNTN